jgi:hypothetical protein
MLHADRCQSVKVAVNTVTPPWTTVMVALVKAMSVISAVQLLAIVKAEGMAAEGSDLPVGRLVSSVFHHRSGRVGHAPRGGNVPSLPCSLACHRDGVVGLARDPSSRFDRSG